MSEVRISYAVWTVHCLNREKFENEEKKTRNLYAYQRGKTALHVPEHSLGGSQQVFTEKISKARPPRPAMTRVQFLFTLVFPSQQIGTYRKHAGT
jgi:hypothetical protein